MMNQIRELNNEEILNYKKIGTATGIIGVCFHMASKHVKNFEERVIGYHIEKNGMAEMVNNTLKEAFLNKEKSISITFYEE